jgi:inner membrane protein
MNQFSLKNSISIRIFIIGFLSLILLIPVLMIDGLISERFSRFKETQTDISSKWGVDQNVMGPVLVVPRVKQITKADGEKQVFNENVYILPEELNISGNIVPQIRYRGIYKTVLYTSELLFSGRFSFENLGFLNDADMLWDQAYVIIGISDLKGINRAVEIEWQQKKVKALPGVKDNSMFLSGITIDIPLKTEMDQHFTFTLNINGSGDLFFAPVGKITTAELISEWPDPVFSGSFLPEKHDITESAFKASWKILDFNRNFPQQWVGDKYKLDQSNFGVTFKFPVNIYQKTERTTKYAIMIIGLTFLTFFMIEILGKKLLHPVQYILIGFALLLFYTLLLALSEYIGFDWSYFLGALSIIAMITLYSKSILNTGQQVLFVSGILTFLYFYLYVILQLQDFALLLGSIGLFVILAVVMYLTRKVDWYNVISK